MPNFFLTHKRVKVAGQHGVRVCRDPDDDALIETAAFGGADVLVTGDQDILALVEPLAPLARPRPVLPVPKRSSHAATPAAHRAAIEAHGPTPA